MRHENDDKIKWKNTKQNHEFNWNSSETFIHFDWTATCFFHSSFKLCSFNSTDFFAGNVLLASDSLCLRLHFYFCFFFNFLLFFSLFPSLSHFSSSTNEKILLKLFFLIFLLFFFFFYAVCLSVTRFQMPSFLVFYVLFSSFLLFIISHPQNHLFEILYFTSFLSLFSSFFSAVWTLSTFPLITKIVMKKEVKNKP